MIGKNVIVAFDFKTGFQNDLNTVFESPTRTLDVRPASSCSSCTITALCRLARSRRRYVRCERPAAAAVEALEGTELDGRDLRVRAYFSN